MNLHFVGQRRHCLVHLHTAGIGCPVVLLLAGSILQSAYSHKSKAQIKVTQSNANNIRTPTPMCFLFSFLQDVGYQTMPFCTAQKTSQIDWKAPRQIQCVPVIFRFVYCHSVAVLYRESRAPARVPICTISRYCCILRYCNATRTLRQSRSYTHYTYTLARTHGATVSDLCDGIWPPRLSLSPPPLPPPSK